MTSDQSAAALTARAGGPLSGAVDAPGDKSISHRALLFGALAEGETRVTGLLEGEDVLRTAAAVRALGASAERSVSADGPIWRVTGGAWASPERPLYCGNSGTGVRLLMGAVAGARVAASFEGDESLRARPMARVLDPLAEMGAVVAAEDGRLPARVSGEGGLAPADLISKRASAQVKSAILLAALGAAGKVSVTEPHASRDHTERMLAAFGVKLEIEDAADGARTVRLEGPQKLTACDIDVPGDPSSAGFPVVAALITAGSDVLVRNVLLNPLRAGLYETLKDMGADLSFENARTAGGEPVADIRARGSALKGVEVPPSRAPSMIDEYPILAVAAAFAEGETMMAGVGELRVKESDRLAATEALLKANGVDVETGDDWMRVRGGAVKGGGLVKTHMDHRIAMSALVMGLAAEEPVAVDDAEMIATSFPTFETVMGALGADIS